MSSHSTAGRRPDKAPRGTGFHVYRTTQLPPMGGGGWWSWDDVVGDAAFAHLEGGGSATLVFAAGRELAMTRLLDVREWNGAGSHHVAILPVGKTVTLVFAVVTPNGPVFVVPPVALASLRRDVVAVD